MKKTVVARPCKEQPGSWEIAKDGKVYGKHFSCKEDCVEEASKLAYECGCELTVTDKSQQSNYKQSKKNSY